MHRILHIVLSICFLLYANFALGQCSNESDISYNIVDQFSCQVDFELSLNVQEDFNSVTTIIRNCDKIYQSESTLDVTAGQNLTFSIVADEGCGCSTYEPIIVYATEDDQGALVTTQCLLPIISLDDIFDNCPSFEVLDNQARINGEFDCTYTHFIQINSAFELDKVDVFLTDCNNVQDSFSLQNYSQENNTIDVYLRNACDCDIIDVRMKLYRDEYSLVCSVGELEVNQYNFITFPLELSNFEVLQKGSELYGEWETLFEIAVNSFSIEYSADGIDFDNILSIEAAQQANYYSYLLENKSGYYRLNVINQDGDYGYSPVQYYEKGQNTGWNNGVLFLDQESEISIFNSMGQLLHESVSDNVDVVSLDLHGLLILLIGENDPEFIFLP